MRLVLDTNIWLDWLVFKDPAIAPLRAAVEEGRVEIVIDDACDAELERVVAYPLGRHSIGPEAQATVLAEARSLATRTSETLADAERKALPRCSDPDDQKFLELAAAAKADYLLTKDAALLALGRRKLPFTICGPGLLPTPAAG